MKKYFFFLLAFLFNVQACFAQFGTGKGQNELFGFGHTYLVVSSNFISHRDVPATLKFSAGGQHDFYYSVTGPGLFIRAFQADSGDAWHGSFSFSGSAIDSSSYARANFKILNLQAKLMQGDNTIINWRDITTYPFVKDTAIYQNGKTGNYKTLYELVNANLSINDSLTLYLRVKATGTQLARIHVKRTPITLQPFLACLLHDSSTKTTPETFIQQAITGHLYQSTDFYDNWPGEGIIINNGKYYPSSKLAFYFRRQNNYPDSSLEYKLTGGSYTDTSWVLSGHLILVTQLQSNADYTLLVKYRDSDEISKYTFYVPPTWYQKYLYFIIYIPAFLILFFSTLFIARYRVKKANAKREVLAVQLKSIRSQLNPHFVFNALSSIQALMNKNEIDLANQYLAEFSGLLRDSLQNHDTELVPLKMDIKMLEHYIKLEQLRFNFKYSIAVKGDIDVNTVEVPSLLLQPLVENAIKHGISVMKQEGLLQVIFSQTGSQLTATIQDNGKGFNEDVTGQGKHGMRLTRERVALLNRQFKGQLVELNIYSIPGKTKVDIVFNNWL
ncbi:MAG TPA: histidine kinase [Chitinophagaceae bacterium]|nr:histidine kinase [Chitinophagaceae bacterium]